MKEEYIKRYEKAAHAMQSAVQYEISSGKNTDATPKHLRVGINSSLTDSASLAKLLMAKGIITEEEYFKSLAEGMEQELASYQKKYPGITFV